MEWNGIKNYLKLLQKEIDDKRNRIENIAYILTTNCNEVVDQFLLFVMIFLLET